MEDERETTSLRQRRKKYSSISLSGCFHGNSHRFDSYDFSSAAASPDIVDKSSSTSPMLLSPSSWFRSKSHELPETKSRSRKFMSKICRHTRRHSADFSYDPLSYALNFDEGPSEIDDFAARLPVSPPRIRAPPPRLKKLELPSPPTRKCATTEPPAKNIEMPSTAVGRRSSVESPTARTGRRSNVERSPQMSRQISVE